ncbi:unnamed protein product [Mytilus coruscus]|uniref:exodeoxyribonuclease III n=1 Tax=Mytilus coruscus TaxID=42192 RepID=A0A6J8B793_MYTCO|nr:unnamed protein product [Mytilus coruscus]
MANYCINLTSLNVNGFGNDFKHKSMFLWLKKFQSDIIFLQETHSIELYETIWKREWGGDIYFSHGEKNSRGVAILFNSSTDYILKEKIADENGRYLILTVEIDNTDFVFVNYYAPTKNFENEQIGYIEKIKILLNEKLYQNLVLGGDLNTVLNPILDKMGGSKYNTPVKYTSKLEDFIEEFALCDIWRTKNVDSRLYTWRQRTPLIQCRLDFWLISNFLSSSVTKTSIVPSIKSDHSLIKLTLSGENFSERGPGFWKFNSGLLTDRDYVDIVKNTLSECDNKYHNLENKTLKWDTIKNTCIEKMESIIKMWRIRNLSLIGKIVILKSLAISKLIYVISSTHVPRSFVIKIQRDINSFLWNGSTPKVKSEVIQKSPSEGGLKAPNFEVQLLSFRIMWVKRFLSEHDSKWKHVSKAFFSLFDLEDLLISRCEFEFLNLKAPLFYIEVSSAWKRFKGIFIPLNAFHVRKEFIWFNPFIKVDRTSIFYRSWYMKGIRFINDIVDDKGEFLSHDAINKKYNLNVTFVDILSIKLAIPRD